MTLDTLETLMGASVVLLLGRQILARTPILRTYSIPEPVIGGLLVAFLVFALRAVLQIDVRFDTTLQTPLMLTFFATIGLNADLAGLKAGGRSLIVFLGAVVGLLVMQDALGLVLAWALGQERLLGLLGASVTLSGGHGTGAAWAKVFAERHGLASATEIAIACATFGLILGGLIGGPVARFLITRYSLVHNPESDAAGMSGFEQPKAVRPITANAVIETIALIAICLAVGSAFASWLAGTAFELPAFVCVLFVGVVLCNGLAVAGWYQVFEDEVSLLGNVSLGLFLAIALMSLRLGDLASLRCRSSPSWWYRRSPWPPTQFSSHSGSWGATTTPRCWPPDIVVSASGQRRRRSPTCRPSRRDSAPRIWLFWWCRWWEHSLSTLRMRSSSSCSCCCPFTDKGSPSGELLQCTQDT